MLLCAVSVKAPCSRLSLSRQVNDLKSRGVRIIGVGVTDAVDETLMRQIVSVPNSDYFQADDFDKLQAILDEIIEEVTFSVTSSVTFSVTSGVTQTRLANLLTPHVSRAARLCCRRAAPCDRPPLQQCRLQVNMLTVTPSCIVSNLW